MVILFVLAEAVAIGHYAWSSSFTRAKIFTVSNSAVGGVNQLIHNTVHLFELPAENRALSERIAELETQLSVYTEKMEVSDSLEYITFDDPTYNYIVARVVSNSINKNDNYIALDRGIADGVYEKMAVITPQGQMVGYVEACTEHYSAALSVLSSSFTTGGKIKDGTNYGSIRWPGTSRYHVTMSELSKYEQINLGDTVVSTGFSQIFPGGVTVGQVSAFSLNEMHTAYNVEIELSAQITAIDYVLLVGNRERGEVEELLLEVESQN